MPLLYDMHTHTTRSFDAEASLRAQCARAEAMGLTGFAVTDHCDVNMQSLNCARTVFAAGGADLRRLREDGLPFELLQGIELGEPLEDLPYAEEMLSLLPYDYVIGSIHNSPGQQDFYFLDCGSIDLDKLLKPYFEELIRLAQWAKTDSIAHITYPLRYIEGKYNRKVDLTPYLDLIDELFRTIRDKGLALEINASGLRQEIGRPMPDERFIRRYYELGGRKIIFGSDAHTARDLAAGIPECMDLCRNIGFKQAVFFRNRQEIEYNL
ncbi:MAG: PHP domain-containing protein [Candidatus Merdivicinus sp.]